MQYHRDDVLLHGVLSVCRVDERNSIGSYHDQRPTACHRSTLESTFILQLCPLYALPPLQAHVALWLQQLALDVCEMFLK